MTFGKGFSRCRSFGSLFKILRAYGNTDIGLHREQNEDSFLVANELSLYGVADGIGGLPFGHEASRLALDCVRHWGQENEGVHTEDDLRAAILYANETVCREGGLLAEDTGIGTTLSVMCVKPEFVMVGHVGDSSCYLFRHGRAAKLTKDHTLAQEIFDQIPAGEKRPDVPDYFHHSLTRCLGQTDDFKADIYSYEIKPGDRLMACTDGVTDLLDLDDLHSFANNEETPELYIDKVIETALRRGGHDNTTAVAVFL